MISAATNIAPGRAERRNFQRVRVKVYGRYMLENRSEHSCHVIDMSPGDVAFRTNLVTVEEDRMLDYSSGDISSAEAHDLIAALNEAVTRPGVRFHGGVS